jgi:predicted RNA-binding protein (virulence factor B family)
LSLITRGSTTALRRSLAPTPLQDAGIEQPRLGSLPPSVGSRYITRMTLESVLGRHWTLPIRHLGTSGASLGPCPPDGGPNAVVLLPKSEVPEGARVGDSIRVFVYPGTDGRPVASTRTSRLDMGEVAFLEVMACSEFGAFVDWGLPKQLLVPFAEQTKKLAVGDREPIGLYRDSSGRLAGTMRISEMLEYDASEFELDEWVDGEAWRNDSQIGLFVIIERQFVGLVPRHEPHSLSRGQAARFRVARHHEDGKIELSLRAHAHEELAGDAEKILAALSGPRPPRIGDSSSPEAVRALFGISKKAFKRAVGTLLKSGAVEIDRDGALVLSGRGSSK